MCERNRLPPDSIVINLNNPMIMKFQNQRSFRLLSLATVAFALMGCPETTARDAAQNPGGSFPAASQDWDLNKLKAYPFDQRAEFSAAVIEVTANLDTRIAALGPVQSAGAPANENRIRAREEVQSARAILAERITKVDQAIPANWTSVRNEVLAALSQLQAAYERAARI